MNFKSFKLENLSFANQIHLFQNSKVIIAPHGAGLANLIFASENTKVIEIRPKNHPNEVYKKISEINNLEYNLYSTPNLKNLDEKGDIKVDLGALKKLLTKIF